jgi:serine protease
MSDSEAPDSAELDQQSKVLAGNLYGTAGGKFLVSERIDDLGGGAMRISVRVTAVDAQNNAEPWVDAGFAGTGLSSWRLDVGMELGGNNDIDPGGVVEVTASGVIIFDGSGQTLAELDIDDGSDTFGLSGNVSISQQGGADIAGVDVSTLEIYWEIKVTPDSGFQVTAGQSGAWFDPSHNGEGYVLQIISETLATVFWFTYDKDGNQYWMIGSAGEIRGSRIIFDELVTTKGGKFGPGYNADDVELSVWGSLEFEFIDCDNAVASYNGIEGFGTGTLNVTRLSAIWGIGCNGAGTVSSGTGNGFLSPGFSGAWFDITHNYEGFTLEILDETHALLYWFTYDTEGNQAWLILIADIEGASIFATDVLRPTGGKFGPDFNPDDVVLNKWGAAVFSFGTCTTFGHGGSMRYLPPPDYGIESTLLLYRLIFIEGIDCNFLSDVHDISGQMTVSENIFIDSDVNDPNIAEVPNDPGDGLPDQQLVPPARVVGFVTATPTGVEGDRFETENDEWDSFILTLREGEAVTLTVSDWDPSDKSSVDLDLYLIDINNTDNVLDSSVSVEEQETVTAPHEGNFFVMVHANAGQSTYQLASGQGDTASSRQFDITANFVPGQVMAAVPAGSAIESVSGAPGRQSRIAEAEYDLGLERIKTSPEGEILYELDSSKVMALVPHPLSRVGMGSITPEQWRVIRAAKALGANSDYSWAGPNYILDTDLVPNDPGYQDQWHYEQIRLPEAWEISRGSTDVVVAVIDTGVWDHADIAANVDYSLGYDFVSDIFDSGDGDGQDADARDPGELYPAFQPYVSHGTHVAGTVGARTNNARGVAGVNWEVTLMPIRVLGVSGGGTCDDINQALRWAGRLANDSGQLPSIAADIINLSLGGPAPCPGQQSIIDQLTDRGIVVIAAAGNDGNSLPHYPAALPNVFSVSSTTVADELAYYSTFGSTVDLSAPGGDTSEDLNNDGYPDGVLSPSLLIEEGSSVRQDSYLFFQGTSMASPHAAGVAALMKSVYPEFGPGDFSTALASGAITDDLAQNGETNKDPQFGYGRIDALKAVQWAVTAEQGQETDVFMTSSTAALDFDSSLMSREILIEKAGTGNLSVTDVGWADDWVSIASVDVDADGFGRYRVAVNRDGLIDGQYTSWIRLTGSDGSELWISVLMRVGESVSGVAGYVYALMLDQWTVQNVKSWDGPQDGIGFDISLTDSPPGEYFLMVSTDLDNDFEVCDDGELCELYPSNSTVDTIKIDDRDVQLGTFRMTFPIPFLKSAGQGPAAIVNSMAPASSVKPEPIRIQASRPRN